MSSFLMIKKKKHKYISRLELFARKREHNVLGKSRINIPKTTPELPQFFFFFRLLHRGPFLHKRLLEEKRAGGTEKRMVVIRLPHFALSYSIRQWRLQGKTRNWSLGRINQAFSRGVLNLFSHVSRWPGFAIRRRLPDTLIFAVSSFRNEPWK